jgi:NADH:ubiquinone oxidoreductase subunit 2 (subunit N)
VITSLTSLFYYLKLFFNMLTNIRQIDKLNQNIYTKINNINLIFCSILINIILPALIFLT